MKTCLYFKRMAFIIPLILFVTHYTRAQGYIPNVIPPSPNASSLMKFTDVPVSPYTGTADITVPIYTIEAKGISLPVTLGYHTGGIRLKEEAGWVGLGWAMNFGGMISRTIMDKDDFGSGAYFTKTDIPQLAGDITPHTLYIDNAQGLPPDLYLFYCNYKVNMSSGQEDLTNAFTNTALPWDLEPDIYSFNFLGHAGKFIITRDRKIIMQKQENLKIEFAFANPTTPDYINSFVITDEQGNKYYFNDKERTQYATGASSTNTISSWAISKIVSQQKDSIMFTYANDGSSLYTAPEIHHTYTSFCNGTGFNQTNGSGTYYTNQVLQSIDFSNGQIQFVFDNVREDIQTGKKLNAVKIYSKANGTLNYLKEQDFYYSYFNAGQPYGNNLEYERLRLDSVKEKSNSVSLPAYGFSYNNPPTNINYTNKHSYSIDHWGYFNAQNNTSLIPTTTIVYDAPGLTSTTYTYYGANRAPSSVSDTKVFSLASIKYPAGGKTVLDYENNEYDYGKSVTGPQENANIQTGPMQTQIGVYQRGDSLGTVDFTNLYPIIPQGVQGTNLVMDIAFRDSQNGVHNYKNTFGKIYFHIDGPGFNITEDISTSNVTCDVNSPVCHASLNLKVTQYANFNWKTHIDPTVGNDFQDIHVTFTYQGIKDNNNTTISSTNTATLAGGLRVKTITDYTDNNGYTSAAKQRSFEYGYNEQNGTSTIYHTYGKLMSYPSYTRKQLVPAASNNPPGTMPTYYSCPQVYLYSSSNTSLTSVIQGNIVGYDQVNEYTVDVSNGQTGGKTTYAYYNLPDTVPVYNGFRIPGILNIGNNLNGAMLTKTVYSGSNGNYQPLSMVKNFYTTKNRSIYYSPKVYDNFGYVTGGGGPDPTNCPEGDLVVGNQVVACFYPSVKSEKILLDSTVEITYDQLDTLLTKTTSRKNYYDNPKHYELTRARMTDSKGNVHVSQIKYPQDYIPNGSTWTNNTVLDSLIGKNMLGMPVEKRDSLFVGTSGTIAGAQLSTYRLQSPANTIVPDAQYALNIQGTVTNFQPFAVSGNTTSKDSRYRNMVNFDAYNYGNNLIQYTATDGKPTAFIWDYQNIYPVAKATNAGIGDIAYTSFEADGNGSWTFSGTPVTDYTAVTGNRVYNLSNGSTSRGLLNTATTYVISYWTKNATSYTIPGSTVKQGESINGWTNFEHSITGVSSVSITGSGLIDELRLYPAMAQMTTFTYEPLVGLSSQCDIGNRITYYKYDGLQRLSIVQDQDRNIIKKLCYTYNGQSAPCQDVFFNDTYSQAFRRNTCGPSDTGAFYNYVVPAGTYSAASTVLANQLAQNDAAANGQNAANQNGTCLYTGMDTLKGYKYAGTAANGVTVKFTNLITGYVISFPFNWPYTDAQGRLAFTPPIPKGRYDVAFTQSGTSYSLYFEIGCNPSFHASGTSATFYNVTINGQDCSNPFVDFN